MTILRERTTNVTRDEGVKLRRELTEAFLAETRTLPATLVAEIVGIGVQALERWRLCGVRVVPDATLLRIVRHLGGGGRRGLPLRVFEDPEGAFWTVWERKILPKERNIPVALQRAGSWLVFRHDRGYRVLFPYPSDWQSCPEKALLEMCSRAISWREVRTLAGRQRSRAAAPTCGSPPAARGWP